MDSQSEVAPDTLAIDLTPSGVEVEYTDGRTVFYHGVPEAVTDSVATAPGKDVHVLVTDDEESHGVLTYVDERTTEDEILEDSGVGRVLLDDGEETSIFPGVIVREADMRVEVQADHDTVDGRVFVFEEDGMGERSFEIVDEDSADEDGTETEHDAGGDPPDGS